MDEIYTYYELSKKLISTLTPREERIFRMREIDLFTLRLTGSSLHLTAQRIHQIENKMHRKLRHPSRTRLMKNILRLADEDIWERIKHQQNAKNNLVYMARLRHLAKNLKEKEKEKYIYLNFFIRILYRNLHEWLAVNSRKYKPGVYTRGNLDKSKINRIINELEDNPVSSKRLYKILKKTYLPSKMIIDMHRLIMNLWRDFANEKIDRQFFVYSCKYLFAIDDPKNWS